ncbi:MAG TPA: GNAT family N-acetyltransferase [Haploplasma sp.]|nr:GNAT family N-acetyltransferase [Haploplasma sp.]
MAIIREAKKEDAALVFDFITKLAEYEKMTDEVVGSVELIEKWVFDQKKAEVVFIMKDNKEVGFALYFYNFSTFLSKPGIYLEDVYILPDFRKQGLGKMVFDYLINKAKNEGLSRIEWVCLDWNTPSIDFYKKIGAKALDEWTTYRLDNKAIIEFK